MRCLFTVYTLFSVWSLVQQKTAGSGQVTYYKIGCYKDNKSPRPLPELLSTDRDKTSPRFSGHLVDWQNWNSYIKSVVSRCAVATRNKGYEHFGLQYYGECWSGPRGSVQFDRSGPANSCVTTDFDLCSAKSPDVCVGGKKSNFVYGIAQKGEEKFCPVSYSKVGCYSDELQRPRPLPIMIMTDRDTSSEVYSGVPINWPEWNSYIIDLSCRCATKAKEKRYTYFSLQNYGECWSGPDSAQTYFREGHVNACLGKDLKPCTSSDHVCVGRAKANFVYKLQWL